MKKILIFIGVLMAFFTSCGNKEKKEEVKTEATKTESKVENKVENSNNNLETFPKDMLNMVLNITITTFQTGDVEQIKKMSPELTTEEAEAITIFKEAYKKFEYQIIDEKSEGEAKIVTVKLKGPDLSTVSGEAIKKIVANTEKFNSLSEKEQEKMSLETMKEIIDQKVKDPNVKMLEKTVNIRFEKKNGEWEMVEDKEYNEMFAFMGSFGME